MARSLSVVGDRWTLLILREAFLRTRRFADFQAHLGIARPLLAERLRRLVEHGVLERCRYGTHPARFEYRLTQKGLDLHAVLLALVAWGDRWMAGPEGPPLELEHRCGRRGPPVLVCPDCGEPVGPRDLTPRIRETGPAPEAALASVTPSSQPTSGGRS